MCRTAPKLSCMPFLQFMNWKWGFICISYCSLTHWCRWFHSTILHLVHTNVCCDGKTFAIDQIKTYCDWVYCVYTLSMCRVCIRNLKGCINNRINCEVCYWLLVVTCPLSYWNLSIRIDIGGGGGGATGCVIISIATIYRQWRKIFV